MRCSLVKHLVIGAGPTGLGAARQLDKHGCQDWALLDSGSQPGGLASSYVDTKGFTWDVGSHVQFSHYEYFDSAMQEFLSNWLCHQRKSWVWIRDRFVPYPFQNNIRYLPREDLYKCLQGLLDITKSPPTKSRNFREWISSQFGDGMAEVFFVPYNLKIWAHPLEEMSADWVSERVACTDLSRILANLVFERDDVSWGPNNRFQYPSRGGTGAIWQACAAQLPTERLFFSCKVAGIDLNRHEVRTSTGRIIKYENLISTIPLRELITLSGQKQLQRSAEIGLPYTSSNIVGLGLRGRPCEQIAKKLWIYFPEPDCPFYRASISSNFSPYNVPDIDQHWSLMCEVSRSKGAPINWDSLLESVIEGAFNTHLINSKSDIVSTWVYQAPYGYPVPGVHRDSILAEIIPFFEQFDVYSRGRFGMWKYEVSNQDHSFMQGVEVIERLLKGRPEITAFDPDYVNSKKHPWPYESRQTECSTNV